MKHQNFSNMLLNKSELFELSLTTLPILVQYFHYLFDKELPLEGALIGRVHDSQNWNLNRWHTPPKVCAFPELIIEFINQEANGGLDGPKIQSRLSIDSMVIRHHKFLSLTGQKLANKD